MEGQPEGVRDPVDPALLRSLRRAVLDHALSERRRVHMPLLHVGVPGGLRAVFPVRPDEPTDHTLRTDLVASLRHRTTSDGEPVPLVWLTRAGPLEPPEDVDLAWLAAARAAYAEAELPLTMVVANRHGWRDPRSGVGRTWRRLRA